MLPDCMYDYRYERYSKEVDICEDCGEEFAVDELINGRCENCYDNYRDEMHEED